MTQVERVYIDRDNYTDLVFYKGRCRTSPVDMSAVTRMVMTLTPDEVTVDTPVITVDSDVVADEGALDWEVGGRGVVRFTLGDVDGVEGTQYTASLVAYDPDHTDGQVLIDGEYPIQLAFTFYEV